MSRIIRKRGAVFGNFARKTEFIQHVRACLVKAREKYPEFTLEDKDLPIVFYKRGQAAGMAKWLRNGEVYNLEFSIEVISSDWDQMVKDVIPHEVAHMVDRFIHGKCNNHNYIWKNICLNLGGSGEATHNMTVTKARKTTKVMYVASCGTEVWVTKRMHNQILKGQTRVLRNTRGRITAEHCQWKQKKV